MEPSEGVKAAVLRYYESAAGDVEAFDSVLTRGNVALVVGTGPGEGTEGRDAWLAAFGQLVTAIPGLVLEPNGLRAWEEGTVGFAFDEPEWILPDGSRMKTRHTAVARQEGGEWKIVHAHFSVGVPDEEVFELQARWGV